VTLIFILSPANCPEIFGTWRFVLSERELLSVGAILSARQASRRGALFVHRKTSLSCDAAHRSWSILAVHVDA